MGPSNSTAFCEATAIASLRRFRQVESTKTKSFKNIWNKGKRAILKAIHQIDSEQPAVLYTNKNTWTLASYRLFMQLFHLGQDHSTDGHNILGKVLRYNLAPGVSISLIFAPHNRTLIGQYKAFFNLQLLDLLKWPVETEMVECLVPSMYERDIKNIPPCAVCIVCMYYSSFPSSNYLHLTFFEKNVIE